MIDIFLDIIIFFIHFSVNLFIYFRTYYRKLRYFIKLMQQKLFLFFNIFKNIYLKFLVLFYLYF